MTYNLYDYRDINRGFKRKVTRAKNDGKTEIVLSLDMAMNVATALDGLVIYWKNTKAGGEERMRLILCFILGFIFGFFIAACLSAHDSEYVDHIFDEQEAKRDEER